MKQFIAITIFLLGWSNIPAHAVDAYWLDQHNALLYLTTFQLDRELKQMSKEGTKVLLLHADSLPSLVSRFIAWRANEAAGMESIAWIQKPNSDNLKHAVNLVGFKGVQIDDHYFNNPPVSLHDLRMMLGDKELWCSFQPRQFSSHIAKICDQNDVQIYRNSCKATVDKAWNMGITGNRRIALAVYHDGSKEGLDLIQCIEKEVVILGTKLFVFKWKNQEIWLLKLLEKLQKTLKLYKSKI